MASDGSSDDSFGYAVSLCNKADGQSSSLGNLAAVSTIYKNNSIGTTYIFGDDGKSTATWSQQAFLKPIDSSTTQYFGRSVTVLPDVCDTLFISSYGNIPENGHFYYFHILVPIVIVKKHINIVSAVIAIFCIGTNIITQLFMFLLVIIRIFCWYCYSYLY